MSGALLVVGGAGRTGRRVVRRLTALGRPVRVTSRHAAGVAGVEVVRADLTALRVGDPAVKGVDGAIVSVEPPADAAGADAVLHRGVARLAGIAASEGFGVVLVSQIYITRPAAYPDMAGVIRARGRGEQALRDSGTRYGIVRPGWLHDGAPAGVRIEQGDTGDGRVSRDTVADACVAALLGGVDRRTFELFDDPASTDAGVDWAAALGRLTPDQAAGARDGE